MSKFITNSIVESSSGWDECGEYGDVQLYDAVLAVDTKKFKKGDKVDTVSFMFSQSIVQIYMKSATEKDGFTPVEVVEEFPIELVKA
jgi:hypothetical protein